MKGSQVSVSLIFMQSIECQMKLTPGQIGELERKRERKRVIFGSQKIDLLCNSMSEGGMQVVIDDWRRWKKTETVGLTSGRVACKIGRVVSRSRLDSCLENVSFFWAPLLHALIFFAQTWVANYSSKHNDLGLSPHKDNCDCFFHVVNSWRHLRIRHSVFVL